MRSLGVTLGLAQRATASGARIFQVLDREPRIDRRRPTRRRCRRATATSSCAGSRSATTTRRVRSRLRAERAAADVRRADRAAARRAVLQRHRPRRPRRRARSRSSEPTGSGKTSLVVADLAPVRRERRRGAASTAPTSARSTCARCATRSPSSATIRSCSRPRVAENIAYARPRQRTTRSSRRRARAQAHEFISACPRATTRASASAA